MATSLVSPAQPGTRGPGRAATAAKRLAPGRPWAPTQKPDLQDPDISGVPLAFPQAAGTGGRGLRAQDTPILAPPLKIKKWVRLSQVTRPRPGWALGVGWGGPYPTPLLTWRIARPSRGSRGSAEELGAAGWGRQPWSTQTQLFKHPLVS